MNINDLSIESAHFSQDTESGIKVIVLNTGAVLTAEDIAMLMALHSRSNSGLFGHLEKLAQKGSGHLMGGAYVEYGHKSIGDCGATYIFIEGCSMLAAKAIQDSQLYNGQECSTRYIDFGTQPFYTPDNNWSEIAEEFRIFYVESFPMVVEYVAKQNPPKENEKETVYHKAVKARAFDILRGFLPAGATTNIAWHVNLRQAADRLMYLRNHPLQEVRDITECLKDVLARAHQYSFGHKLYQETENYISAWMSEENYHSVFVNQDQAVLEHDGVDKKMLANKYRHFLKSRPMKTELPKQIGITGALRISFLLDFGSFRDVQRQRAVTQLMPFLGIDYGFEDWYLDELPQNVQVKAKILLEKFEQFARENDNSKIDLQYVIPMGYKVACVISGDIPAWVYLAELRATPFVHATLQKKAIQIADILEQTYGECGLVLHVDRSDIGRFDSRRGSQDIIIKN